MHKRLSLNLALVGFVSLSTGWTQSLHVHQESCAGHEHSAPAAPHSSDRCPVCHGLTASSNALVGGTVIVVAPVVVTGSWYQAPVETPVSRFVVSPASPRAPPAR